MTSIELVGWVSSMSLALSVVPQAVLSFRQKHSEGLGWGMLLMWLVGEIGMIIYILNGSKDPVLLANYTINLTGLTIIIYYKLKPRHPAALIRGLADAKAGRVQPYTPDKSDLAAFAETEREDKGD